MSKDSKHTVLHTELWAQCCSHTCSALAAGWIACILVVDSICCLLSGKVSAFSSIVKRMIVGPYACEEGGGEFVVGQQHGHIRGRVEAESRRSSRQ